ncbi:MAG: HPr family phosphocarrier protein [Bacteroidota bacterium]|nr:HPr family phosphocarrier protein [Kiloniellaceae bacterium]
MTGHVDNPAAAAAAVVRRVVTVCNQKGLHARAAAKFVKLAETFDAEIAVEKNETRVPGGSIMGLMMLAAGPGCDIGIEASGPQAQEAVDALAQLVADKFDEDG